MELSEVVNPHFAFPVVGVVLCAFLVFAFGFKSPVQPPSFDFDSADDVKKKRKKPNKKSHANGQIANSTENLEIKTTSPATKSGAAAGKSLSTPKAAAVTDKSPKPAKEAKPKVKKAPSAKPAAPTDVPAPLEGEEGEGWETVSVSKKKKNKAKDVTMTTADSNSITAGNQSSADENVNAPNTTSTTTGKVQALGLHNEPSQTTQTTQLAVISEIGQSQPLDKREQRQRATKVKEEKLDPADKENVPDIDAQLAKTTPIDTDKPIKSELQKTTSKKQSKAPPRGDNQSPKSKSSPKKEGQASPKPSAGTTTDGSTMSATGTSEKSETVAARDSKSPKKKKEKLKKEPVASVTDVKSQVVSSAGNVSEASPLKEQSISSSAQDVDGANKVTPAPIETAEMPTSTTEGAADNTEAQEPSNVTFDEMGDWQEAKPVKKRKTKARRDN